MVGCSRGLLGLLGLLSASWGLRERDLEREPERDREPLLPDLWLPREPRPRPSLSVTEEVEGERERSWCARRCWYCEEEACEQRECGGEGEAERCGGCCCGGCCCCC